METMCYTTHMLLFILLVCSSGIHCESTSDQTSEDGPLDLDGSSYNKRQYIWFGPRLGRNKRNPSDDEIQFKDIRVDDSIVDLIKDSPWALIPLRGSDRNVLSFTPRLGRNNEDEETMEASRSPPFAPRLGRRHHDQSFVPVPRLGRTFSSHGSH